MIFGNEPKELVAVTHTNDTTESEPGDSPVSSASLRYFVRHAAIAEKSGPIETRPFGLRSATVVATPVRRLTHYCLDQQVAVDVAGRPLIETMGKDWKSKSSTDGDEGPEENWGWEE